MASETVRDQTMDVWTFCSNNDIRPKLGNFNAWISPGWRICVYDTASGIGELERAFLLVSPMLSSKYLQRLVTLVRENEITCGFSVREAFDYQVIYLIDPNGDFSDAELAPLALDSDITLHKVTGTEPSDLADELKTLINN